MMDWLAIFVIGGVVFAFGFMIWARRTADRFDVSLLERLARVLDSHVEQVNRLTRRIRFLFDGRDMALIYRYQQYWTEWGWQRGSVEATLRTQTSNCLTLKLLGKTGDSIGRLVDKIIALYVAKGCREVSNKQDLPRFVQSGRLYTNDEAQMRKLLAKSEVTNLLSELSSCNEQKRIPIEIERGAISLRCDLLNEGLVTLSKNPEAIKGYAAKVSLLADCLSS